VLGKRAAKSEVEALVDWAVPIQQRHFQEALAGSMKLAMQEDPNGTG